MGSIAFACNTRVTGECQRCRQWAGACRRWDKFSDRGSVNFDNSQSKRDRSKCLEANDQSSYDPSRQERPLTRNARIGATAFWSLHRNVKRGLSSGHRIMADSERVPAGDAQALQGGDVALINRAGVRVRGDGARNAALA